MFLLLKLVVPTVRQLRGTTRTAWVPTDSWENSPLATSVCPIEKPDSPCRPAHLSRRLLVDSETRIAAPVAPGTLKPHDAKRALARNEKWGPCDHVLVAWPMRSRRSAPPASIRAWHRRESQEAESLHALSGMLSYMQSKLRHTH